MPVNKNAQFRYQILDRCFSDFRHKYDFDTLLELFYIETILRRHGIKIGDDRLQRFCIAITKV